MLSLFLLLLAFFILLNSLASIQEEKSEKVLRSVSATFQRNILEAIELQLLVSTFGETPEPDRIIEEIRTLWVTEVPIAKINRASHGELLSIEIETTELFVAGSTKMRIDRELFLQNLALALTKTYPTLEVSMQFLLGVEDINKVDTRQIDAPDREEIRQAREQLSRLQPRDIFDPNSFSDIIPARRDDVLSTILENRTLSFGRAVNLGDYLHRQGVKKRHAFMGFRKHDPSIIKIRFYVTSPLKLDAKKLQEQIFDGQPQT